MFEGFGPEKLMMVLLIVLVLFGGKRIPEVGASLGKGIREFKRGIRDVTDGINDADAVPARPAASLTAGSVPVSSVVYDDTRGAPKRLLED